MKVEAIHVADIGLQTASDEEIWSYCESNGLTLISKDEDFVKLFLRTPSVKLIWVRIGNCRRGHLIETVRVVWPRIEERFASGDGFVELR
jgi:predicted nuclease of predicted toxin-antitoxin system